MLGTVLNCRYLLPILISPPSFYHGKVILKTNLIGGHFRNHGIINIVQRFKWKYSYISASWVFEVSSKDSRFRIQWVHDFLVIDWDLYVKTEWIHKEEMDLWYPNWTTVRAYSRSINLISIYLNKGICRPIVQKWLDRYLSKLSRLVWL